MYVAAVPAVLLLLAAVTMYWVHDSLEDAWRLGAIAMASLLMLSCVGSLLFNGHRYELRLSPLWAIMATAALGWVYVDYGRSLLQIENRLQEKSRVETIDTCSRHLHISHPACQELLRTRSGRVLDTDDILYRLEMIHELNST